MYIFIHLFIYFSHNYYKFDLMISFDEESHTYTNTETKEKYISVTTLLGKYKHKFDADKHSKRVAEREGVTQEMVLEMWKQENLKATTRGTKIHSLMENYINFGETAEDYSWLYKSYDKVMGDHVESYSKVLTETLVHSETYKVAGMSDLIYLHKDGFTVGDFKTNKKFQYSSSFNEYLTAPVDHLMSCEFNVYGLQLSMYAYLYEKMTGLKCKKLLVYYLRDDKWTPIHCNYLKLEVENILTNYTYERAHIL